MAGSNMGTRESVDGKFDSNTHTRLMEREYGGLLTKSNTITDVISNL